MASERQIAANRRNAARSTGPRTMAGKRRSRNNACRHGLTAKTVIPSLEDAAEYQELEAGLFADFAPATVLERELVARLACLLWRLRRATVIETGLYAAEDRYEETRRPPSLAVFYEMLDSAEMRPTSVPLVPLPSAGQSVIAATQPSRSQPMDVASAYLRICRQSPGAMKRLSRYETALWRQAAQTLLMLGTAGALPLRLKR